jgi:hypothetical protein
MLGFYILSVVVAFYQHLVAISKYLGRRITFLTFLYKFFFFLNFFFLIFFFYKFFFFTFFISLSFLYPFLSNILINYKKTTEGRKKDRERI